MQARILSPRRPWINTLGPDRPESIFSCPLGSHHGIGFAPFSVSWFLTDFDVTWAGGGLRAIFRGGSFTLSDDRGRIGGTYALTAATAVSEPGSIALLLLGVAGLGFAARARRR